MGVEPETTQVEVIPSEPPPIDKTLNTKRHNNVEAKNKDGLKNKRISSVNVTKPVENWGLDRFGDI